MKTPLLTVLDMLQLQLDGTKPRESNEYVVVLRWMDLPPNNMKESPLPG